jgi:hypothetical protein
VWILALQYGRMDCCSGSDPRPLIPTYMEDFDVELKHLGQVTGVG